MNESISPIDRAAVALISLPPCRRAVLETVAAVGPIGLRPLSLVVGRDPSAVLGNLVRLWSLGLVARRPDPKTRHPAYAVPPHVRDLCPGIESTGRERGQTDPATGCAVLACARLLVSEDTWPGCERIAAEVGVGPKVVHSWTIRLRSAGLWPDAVGLTRWDAAASARRLRAARAGKARRAEAEDTSIGPKAYREKTVHRCRPEGKTYHAG